MVSYFEPLIMASIGTASKILNSQQQMAVLDQTKTLAESALQMLYTAKEAGGNPKVCSSSTALPSCSINYCYTITNVKCTTVILLLLQVQ